MSRPNGTPGPVDGDAGSAALTAIAVGGAPAMAHHCFVPVYTLDRSPTSENWFVVSAELGAVFEASYEAPCDGAVDAGYDALRAAGLPVGIKIFEKMTIGDPKEQDRLNPNGADGGGLEYFGAGSELPFQMIETYIEGAKGPDCGSV